MLVAALAHASPAHVRSMADATGRTAAHWLVQRSIRAGNSTESLLFVGALARLLMPSAGLPMPSGTASSDEAAAGRAGAPSPARQGEAVPPEIAAAVALTAPAVAGIPRGAGAGAEPSHVTAAGDTPCHWALREAVAVATHGGGASLSSAGLLAA